MTLESTANRNRYIGNGSATVFNFTFRVWKKDQVKVVVGDGYTENDVSARVAVEITSTGGTVTFPTAPASGTVIILRRNMPYIQEDDYRNGTRFDAEEVEDRLDQDCAERQDLLLGLSRCLQVPETSEASGDQIISDIMQARQDVLDALAEAGDVTGATAVTATGSTAARMLRDRFADWINVRDFGAKGDGSDDTAAIQAALDYANADADNRPVVAFGDFVITSTLEMGRPSSTRQDEPQQEFYFGNLICGSDLHPWQGESTDPAVHFRAWRGIFYVDKIDCRKQCAGLFVDTYGAEIHNPAVSNFAVDTYGLKWSEGGNVFWNPKINHDRETESENQGRIPGILCSGIDSKVFGGVVGNCSPGIDITTGSFNFFHGVHVYCGSSEYPVTDPVLVRSITTNVNYLFNCYYDSGHIDIYKTGLRISGGHFLNNSSIATINGTFIRCYAEDSSGNFPSLNVFNVHNARASFADGDSTAIPDTFDYSVINGLTITGGQEMRYERQTKRVLPNNYNAPFEDVYKPVGTLCRRYHVGSGVGVEIDYLDNGIRICDPADGAGARLRLGGGSAGISEDADNGGHVQIWANGTVHVECAGEYGESSSGYVRPGVDSFDTLGTSGRRWKELFCANGTINTSDERSKQQIADIPEAVFRAWGKVKFQQYKFNDAVEAKGEAARFHVGAIAQRIVEAFEEEGLDATRYGLLCYDEWAEATHTVKVVDAPAVVDAEDRTVQPEQYHMEEVVEPAGSRYSLRYAECLCMEAAYQRWRLEQIESRLTALEV